jgi:hypothetical protein
MHWLKLPFWQTLPPLAHVQLPPGPVQVWPVIRQSLLVQQVLLAMHELLTEHAFSPDPQVHVLPGVGQVEPAMLLQSLLSQQFALEMHALFATHAW